LVSVGLVWPSWKGKQERSLRESHAPNAMWPDLFFRTFINWWLYHLESHVSIIKVFLAIELYRVLFDRFACLMFRSIPARIKAEFFPKFFELAESLQRIIPVVPHPKTTIHHLQACEWFMTISRATVFLFPKLLSLPQNLEEIPENK